MTRWNGRAPIFFRSRLSPELLRQSRSRFRQPTRLQVESRHPPFAPCKWEAWPTTADQSPLDILWRLARSRYDPSGEHGLAGRK